MKSYSFYFNASDWLASPAVKLMSKAERGVYINLLALAWGMEQPGTLPANADKVRRLAEMSLDEWAESGEIILEKFPLSECGTYRYNPRLLAEAGKEQVRSEKARASAEKRWQFKPDANAMPTHSERNANASENHANASETHNGRNAIVKVSISKEDTPNVASAKAEPVGVDFESFWDAYGRKEGSKAKMARQWDGLKLATRQTILNGLAAYKQAKTVNGPQFMPMPQTFLNGRLWEAESYGVAPAPQTGRPLVPNDIPSNAPAFVPSMIVDPPLNLAFVARQEAAREEASRQHLAQFAGALSH